jgi:hypothetical protein
MTLEKLIVLLRKLANHGALSRIKPGLSLRQINRWHAAFNNVSVVLLNH